MKNAVAPFFALSDDMVCASGWRVILEGQDGIEMEDPLHLETWDNATDIRLEREIRIAINDAAQALELRPDEARLEVLIIAGTGEGRLPDERWLLFQADLSNGAPAAIGLVLEGHRLAGSLFVETIVVLAKDIAEPLSALSPRRRGDILWRDTRRIRLEGNVSRFPVSQVDLNAFLGRECADSLWYLDVDWSDWGADFDTAVRLYVNPRNSDFARRFAQAEPDTLQAVMADVLVQLVREWLDHEGEFPAHPLPAETGSLATTVGHWVELAFGDAVQARRLLKADPGLFHARLNALAATGEANR